MDISKKINDLSKSTGQSIHELAEVHKLPESRVHAIENGASPTIEELILISRLFNKSIHWFLEGEVKGRRKPSPIHVMDAKAEAGTLDDDSEDLLKSLESFQIPGFSGTGTLLFKVHGTSMYPTVAEHDFLIASKVESFESLGKEEVLIVKLADKILVKRVTVEGDNLLLQSDNDEFEDQVVKKEDVKAAWKVKGKITRDFIKKTKSHYRKILEMNQELASLKRELNACRIIFSEVKGDRAQEGSGV